MKRVIRLLAIYLLAFANTQAVQAQDDDSGETFDFFVTATIFSAEGVIAVKKNGKFGFRAVDAEGALIIPCKYDDVDRFSEGLAAVKLNGKWGFVDKKNKVVIPFKYDDARNFSEGLAAVSVNKKYGFIDRAGKLVIPYQYDYVMWSFKEGLVPVELKGRYGYIDINAKTVIPFKYGFAGEFKNGRAEVGLGDRNFYIDRYGNEVKE